MAIGFIVENYANIIYNYEEQRRSAKQKRMQKKNYESLKGTSLMVDLFSSVTNRTGTQISYHNIKRLGSLKKIWMVLSFKKNIYNLLYVFFTLLGYRYTLFYAVILLDIVNRVPEI